MGQQKPARVSDAERGGKEGFDQSRSGERKVQEEE